MENNLEKFYRESNFTFETYSCHYAIDRQTLENGEKKETIVIFPDYSRRIKLAYQPKYGLVKVSEKTGAATDKDVLSELLNIKKNNLKAYGDFFQKYGFLFPINSPQVRLSHDDLCKIIDRIKVTTDLLSMISENQRKNYSKLTHYSYWLLTNNSIKIDELNYSACPHTLLHKNLDHEHNMDVLPRKYVDNDHHKIAVKDYGYGEFVYDIEEYYGLKRSNYDEEYGEGIHNKDIFCISSYINHTDAPYKERILIEFNFHCQMRIHGLTDYRPETDRLYEGRMNLSQLEAEFKATSLEASKIILAEEISYYIKNIHPIYDHNTMRPTWKVDSLISALYYSLFFINPNTQIVRRCANVNCNNHIYFTVTRTSSKKIYCCPECCRNVQQRKHREKVKLNSLQNEEKN